MHVFAALQLGCPRHFTNTRWFIFETELIVDTLILVLPRHDEFGSKVSKFNQEADKICEVTAVEFLNNTKLLADIENYVYKSDPTECVKLTEQEQGLQINLSAK